MALEWRMMQPLHWVSGPLATSCTSVMSSAYICLTLCMGTRAGIPPLALIWYQVSQKVEETGKPIVWPCIFLQCSAGPISFCLCAAICIMQLDDLVGKNKAHTSVPGILLCDWNACVVQWSQQVTHWVVFQSSLHSLNTFIVCIGCETKMEEQRVMSAALGPPWGERQSMHEVNKQPVMPLKQQHRV
ncbi:UNVERIFIED_CONTAM: hypothetical protein K2H54_033793 [Gekko kuhli]